MDRASRQGGADARPQRASDPADIDMTGVDPLRMAEVRRRIAVIRSHIALTAPTDRDRLRHAKSLGLSINQFLMLVRIWREQGTARSISGSGATRGAPRATGPRNLPTESKTAAKAVISALGPDVPHVEAVALVEARCAALGVKAPSRSTIWNMIMAARREAGGDPLGGLIVSRCHAKIPVERPDSVGYPMLLLVVDASNGAIVAAALDSEEQAAATVGEAIRLHGAGRQVLVDADLATSLKQMDGSTIKAIKPTAARTATAKSLGRGFGSVELIYQIGRAVAPERMLRSRKDRPLSPADARHVLFEQMSQHNAARNVEPPIVSWRT